MTVGHDPSKNWLDYSGYPDYGPESSSFSQDFYFVLQVLRTIINHEKSRRSFVLSKHFCTLGFSLELDEGTTTSHQWELHWLPVQRRVDFNLACFVISSFPARHLRTWLMQGHLDTDTSFTSISNLDVLGWWRRLGLGRSLTSAPLVQWQIVTRCYTHTQHVRRQELCCCRATCLEQPPSTLARRRSHTTVLGANLKLGNKNAVSGGRFNFLCTF